MSLHKSPLHELHLELGGHMVPFAGYEMPLHYRNGILKEHLQYTGGGRPLRCLAHGTARAVSAEQHR